MELSKYHQKYVGLTEESILFGLRAKEIELTQVLEKIKYQPSQGVLKIAVLGCADKRFVKGHKILFQKLLGCEVNVITFDITIDHLKNEENIVQHDCTLPLPNKPFDLIFSHILLKFISPEKQWAVLENSFLALNPGGVALHFMDVGGKTLATSMIAGGVYQIDLENLKFKLQEKNIKSQSMVISSLAEKNRDLECLVIFK
jgi:hypothetical protein